MTEELEVIITEDDIVEGRRLCALMVNAEQCPVALAIKRQFKVRQVYVTNSRVVIIFDNDDYKTYRVDEEAAEFINNFDFGFCPGDPTTIKLRAL